MAGAAEREALKQRALLALEDARRALSGEMQHLRPYMHPKQLLKDNVKKHRIAYIIGAAAAGLVAVRFLWMPRAAPSTGASTSKGSWFGRIAGLLGAALWPMVKGPVIQLAMRYASSYLPQFFPPTPTPTPEGTE